MRNNNSKLVFEYIINCIDRDFVNDYGYQKQPETDKEKLEIILQIFKREYNFNIKRLGIYQAYMEWLQGLSCAGIDFENYKILQLAKEWGNLKNNASERHEDKILNNWWNFITVKTFILAKRLKINIDFLTD